MNLTWYFNYPRYHPEGAGVTFRRGRVVAVFTHRAPPGWHTPGRITIGAPSAVVARRYDALPPTTCGSYTIVNVIRLNVINAFDIVDDQIWGFGIITARVAPCLP